MLSARFAYHDYAILWNEDKLNNINDNELLLLHDVHRQQNPQFPYWRYEKVNLELKEGDECKAEFRVRRDDIYTLADTFGLPENCKCYNGVVGDSVEALCSCLGRLAYTCRYGDIVHCFARPVIDEMYEKFANCLTSMDQPWLLRESLRLYENRLTSMDQPWLLRESLRMYADTIHAKSAALDNCWGFVDGTVRAICRPKVNQGVVYNVHKKVHSLNFQSVVAPNGLIAYLFGPVEGRRHDAEIVVMFGLLDELEEHSYINGDALCIYGHAAYPLQQHLQCPF